jgi:UDP-GlcNAc:undecaprenyl-phosphate/decaprenyl-phosphate GlcNAc-1-phosphate transferase
VNTYFALFLIATCTAVVLTPLVRRACERWGWLDHPGDVRRVHQKAVPRLGGVAVFASVLVALVALLLVDNLITQALRANVSLIAGTLAPAALIFLFGVYDDLRGTGARAKFAALGVAAAVFYAMGGRIELLSIPLVGAVELPRAVSFVVTVVWVVGVANAFNLIDGVDGLAAGAALFASLVMLVVALLLGHPVVAVVACALCGALIGFLRYNFNPASIFLGDSGALFVGFVLAALSVHGTQKASTAVAVAIPLLAFGVPVVDTGFTLVRRFVSGSPLFEGDRGHIHHMLLARGWSQRRVAFVLYGACALFGMAALFLVGDAGRMTGLMLFIVAVAVTLAVGRLRYHEVDELKASVRRNLGERRLRGANNVRVRRAARRMSEAGTAEAMLGALVELLELGEFVHARVLIGRDGCGDEERDGVFIEAPGDALTCVDDGAWPREVGASEIKVGASEVGVGAGGVGVGTSEVGASEVGVGVATREVKPHDGATREVGPREVSTHNGVVRWSWERGDISVSDIYTSGRFWTLRLPLTTERGAWGYINLYRGLDADELLLDFNYLCRLFQRETAQAAERIFGGDAAREHEDARGHDATRGHNTARDVIASDV